MMVPPSRHLYLVTLIVHVVRVLRNAPFSATGSRIHSENIEPGERILHDFLVV